MNIIKISSENLFNGMLMNGLVDHPSVVDVDFVDKTIEVNDNITERELVELYGEDPEWRARKRISQDHPNVYGKIDELRQLIREEIHNIITPSQNSSNLNFLIKEFNQEYNIQPNEVEKFLELYVNKDFLGTINFRDEYNVSEIQMSILTKDLVENDHETDVGIKYDYMVMGDESDMTFEFIEELKDIVAEHIKANMGVHIEW